MNKGISVYWGFVQDMEVSIKMLKEIGFNCIITSADKKYKRQNGSLKRQVGLCKKYGLELSSLHSRYDSKKSTYLWNKGLKGYIQYKKLLNDVKSAKKYGFRVVVVHLYGEPSEIGYNRIRKILNVCEKFNIYFAIENIRKNDCLEGVFNNIKSNYLKFCYDIGHNNCFTPNYDFLEKFGDKLICLHLHDNMGEKDNHTLNKYGNINWDLFAEKLKKIKYDGNLDYEILKANNNENAYETAKQVYLQAIELEQKIKN